MWDCSALTSLDLSHTKVVAVGHHFLAGCSAIAEVAMPRRSWVTLGRDAYKECGALVVRPVPPCYPPNMLR